MGMYVTDDGIAFIAIGTYASTSSVVYDLNTGTDLGDMADWIKVGSINSIFYFLHKAAEPFNCLEQDNLAQS